MTKKQTPMMEQYFDIKSNYQEELLFFRLGDFYELFYDDALIASRELNITLTGRNAGQEDKAPMCGVPFHSAEGYIEKLVKKGFKVAICEQVEDPKETKGIVKRDVIRVITPGTVMTENGTEARENNFLALFYEVSPQLVLLFCDISTGEVIWETLHKDKLSYVFDALSMYRPKEIVLPTSTELWEGVQEFLQHQMSEVALSPYSPKLTLPDLRTLATNHFSNFGLMEESVLEAFGYLLSYLKESIKADVSHLTYVHQLHMGDRMILDTSSLRHLEISRNLRDGGVRGTLLHVMDKTITPMGARLLKQWVESPLMDINAIQKRQGAIRELIQKGKERYELGQLLDSVYDFERILGRIETGSVSPKDFVSLRESLKVLPEIKGRLSFMTATLLQQVNSQLECHEDIHALLEAGIGEQPPLTLRDGHVIRDGFHPELDELRALSTNSEAHLMQLEEDIKAKTGIRLKTGYNKVFGYYFEVSKANKVDVPDYFIRKQTLTNAERYITPELKEFEVKILSAKEKMIALEYTLYEEIRSTIKEVIQDIQRTARAIAQLDVLQGLALVAYEHNYICPTMVTNGQITIRDGRHPVIETYLKREVFVPNDIVLNHNTEEFLLITGPNMAGKSTYMRQAAILMIMAQVGSFIPAREATISPVDRVFTRVGASDDISTGQSTFMVEMKEVAYILEHATPNSLIILDEIGRGTSTFDGLSIAQAVVEYICKHIHSKTLFATHYHELIDLEEMYPKLKNYTVAVKEKGKDIVFLRRIVRGGADRSYGIHVAKLAGLPNTVLKRAETLLEQLEQQGEEGLPTKPKLAKVEEKGQGPMPVTGNLFTTSIVDRLAAMDIVTMTPMEAMNALYQLQEEARQGGGK